MEIPHDIINQAYETKRNIYSDIYDINNEQYYESNINEVEKKYLTVLSIIRKILNNTLEGVVGPATTTIPNISDKSRVEVDKLISAVASAKSDDPTDNIPIESFIESYFFRYPWWLGEGEHEL